MDDETHQPDPTFVTTQEALADRLGVERKSIQRWQKRPDCPGRRLEGFDVEAWRAFIERNNLGRKKAKGKAALEEEKMALQNERTRLQIQKMRGELASYQECAKVLAEMVSGFTLALQQSEPTIVEETVGVDLGEGLKRVRRRHRDVLQNLALGEWAQKKTFWSKVYAELLLLLATPGLGHGAKSTS